MFVFIWKKRHPENFAFRILRILELFAGNVLQTYRNNRIR